MSHRHGRLGIAVPTGLNDGQFGVFSLNADRIADGVFEAGAVIEKVDFDAEKEDWNVAWGKRREADGVFLGGDQGETAAGPGAGEGVFHLGDSEAVVVGKGALIDDFGAEFDQALEKTFRHGDPGDGANPKAAQVGEGFGFPGDHVLEVKGVVGAGKNLGVPVVTADLLLHFSLILALAFGEEDKIRAFQGIGGFAEDAAGEDVAVSERILPVHEEEVKAVAKAKVLVAVVEEKGIRAVVADGVAGRFYAVGIDEHGDAGKVAGEHEGFIAGLGRVEQDGFSV